MIKTRVKSGFQSLPKTYAGLVAVLPPRPIRDDIDLSNASEMIDRLAGFELNGDQEDYLEALSRRGSGFAPQR